MSLDLGTLVGYLKLDPTDWDKGTDHAKSGLSKFVSTGLTAVGTLVAGVVATGAAIGTAVGAIALKGGFSRAMNIQEARASLAGLKHDTAEIDTIMGNALDSVRGTAFGMGDAAQLAASAVAAGIPPGTELTRVLSLMADSATIGKTSLGEMGSMWNKVATDGHLTTEVMQQFHDRGIPLLTNVAKYFGVTNDAAQKMVTDGKVSFAQFEQIMDDQLGGAAKRSGETARGAWANVGAAFSRLGILIAGPAVAAAPQLFTAISTAVDSLTKYLGPLGDKFASWLTPAVASLSGWLEHLDFSKVVESVGQFSPLVQILKLLQPILPQLAAAFAPLIPLVVDLAAALGPALAAILPELVSQLVPLVLTLAQLASQGLAVALPLLTEFTRFLGENAGAVVILLGVIVGWRTAMAISTAVHEVFTAAIWKQIAAKKASTLAWLANTAAAIASKAQTLAIVALYAGQFIAGMVRSTASVVANTAATVASRVAMVAGAVALGVVTAAQWLWNAAMSANPIGLIILAVAGLIAIIVLLITHWDEVISFLSDAWGQFVGWFTGLMDGFLKWWGGLWDGLMTGISAGWDAVVAWFNGLPVQIALFFIGIALWLLKTGQDLIAGLGAGIVAGWNAVVSFFTGMPAVILSFLVGAAIWLAQTGIDLIGGLLKGVNSMWTGFLGFLKGIPGAVLGFFSGIGSWLFNAGKDLINGLLNGIKSLAGTIGKFFLGLLPGWIVGPFKAALGIHSPSTVFAGYGRNIIGGLVQGLDAEQSGLDDRMQELVTVPAVPRRTAPHSAAGDDYRAGRGAGSAPQAILDMRGANVGWMPDEVKARMDKQAAIASTLAGVDEDVPVA